MDERQYSRPLDVHRISEYPEVQKVIQVLFGELKSKGHIGKSPKKKILKHLKAVVLDLYVGYSSDPQLYIGYPRDRNKYSKDTRLGHLFFGFRPMMRVIDGLEVSVSGTGTWKVLTVQDAATGKPILEKKFYYAHLSNI